MVIPRAENYSAIEFFVLLTADTQIQGPERLTIRLEVTIQYLRYEKEVLDRVSHH
jgi:hypothetical protein